MKQVIEPVSKDLLLKELTEDKFIRETNNGNKKIYIFTHKDSPNLMREIGRLREITFRDAGGGTGLEMDIDEFDISDKPYHQLIVWDPEKNEILGGYRFFDCTSLQKEDIIHHLLATTELFEFSDKFIEEYLPYTFELGRSFVQPEYQASKVGRKGLYTLDNLWDGLGAIVTDNPKLKYFFGKVTMYTHYNPKARDILLHFMRKHFPDNENLLSPIDPLVMKTSEEELNAILSGNVYAENYKILQLKVKELNENIPPLINSYMNLSPTMKVFGTAINKHFGGVEETGILVKIDDIYESKKNRHIVTYKPVIRENPTAIWLK